MPSIILRSEHQVKPIQPGAFLGHFKEYALIGGGGLGVSPPFMGPGMKPCGRMLVFRAF